jgi:hypothetical protein
MAVFRSPQGKCRAVRRPNRHDRRRRRDARTCIVAVWLILCGLSLYGIEKYIHELQLDQYDALLNAEAHEQVTSLYLKGMSGQLEQVAPSEPLSTNVDAALAAAIARRAKETPKQAPARREPSPDAEQPSLFPESALASGTHRESQTGAPPSEPSGTADAHEAPVVSPKQEKELSQVPVSTAMRHATLPAVAMSAVAVLIAAFGYDYYRKAKAAPTGPDRIEITTVTIGSPPTPSAAAPSATPELQPTDDQREKAELQHQFAMKAAELAKANRPEKLEGGFAWRVRFHDGANAYIASDGARATAHIRQLRARGDTGDKAAQQKLSSIYAAGVYEAGTGALLVPMNEEESERWRLRSQIGPVP